MKSKYVEEAMKGLPKVIEDWKKHGCPDGVIAQVQHSDGTFDIIMSEGGLINMNHCELFFLGDYRSDVPVKRELKVPKALNLTVPKMH